MKNFFTKFKRSLSDREFYKDLASGLEPMKIRYAIGLALLCAFVAVVSMTIALYAALLPGARSYVSESVPEDLEVTIKSGELSINQPSPYVIPFPEEEKDENFENFLVIDIDAPATLEKPAEYQTMIFANKTTLVAQKDTGEVRAVPLKEIPDTTFNRDIALGFVDTLTRFAWVLPILAYIPLALFGFLKILLVSLVGGFLLWLVFKIAKRTTGYKNAFALAMHGYTAVFLIDLILTVCGVPVLGIFYSALIITVFVSILVFVKRGVAPQAPEAL